MDRPTDTASAHTARARDGAAAASGAVRIGCVSYLNAKPLIEGLDDGDAAEGTTPTAVRYDVPARLLSDLEAGDVDIALCPVIDYHRAARPLSIVPVGGIGCDGPTLTVRLFSRVPIERITTVYADSDSHTSVALLRIVLANLYGIQPKLVTFHAREHVAEHRIAEAPEAMLLIGDKVVTDSPLAVTYPYQLDLGEAWQRMAGLPFVFAVWMARRDATLGDVPQRLATQRAANAQRIEAIVDKYAQRHGWPRELAQEYHAKVLRYEIGQRELQAIERFGELAARHGLIQSARPLRVWG